MGNGISLITVSLLSTPDYHTYTHTNAVNVHTHEEVLSITT